jgi:hypothetical protein
MREFRAKIRYCRVTNLDPELLTDETEERSVSVSFHRSLERSTTRNRRFRLAKGHGERRLVEDLVKRHARSVRYRKQTAASIRRLASDNVGGHRAGWLTIAQTVQAARRMPI